jgi:hypothetical protein
MRKILPKICLFFAGLLAAVAPARAQVSPIRLDTVSSTLASGATCTGSAQNFTTAQGIPNFINKGQTHHLATAISSAASFMMEIDGLDNAGNTFRLSNVQVGVPSSAQGGLVVEAAGYMTNIQVKVTCTSGATFTLSYSGDFSTSTTINTAALLAATDKLPFQTAAANTTASSTFQSPTGNSSGTIIFQYAATGPSGSTITAQCVSNAGANLTLFTFSATTGTAAQLFNVSTATCPFVTLSYNSGGASATTYNLEYVFNPIGAQTTTNDPCTSGAQKKTVVVNPTDAANTILLISGVAGQVIYPCTISVNVALSTSDTVLFEYGTGSSCSSPTAVTGTYETFNTLAIVPIIQVSGPTAWNIPAGASLCVLLAGTGSQWGVKGFISYAQQ